MNKTISEYIELIEQWARDRELDKKGTVEAQKVKTAEEMAELIKAISKDNIDDIKDSIGDVFVTLVIGNMLEGENIDIKYQLGLHEYREREKLEKEIYDILQQETFKNSAKISAIKILSYRIADTMRNSYKKNTDDAMFVLLRIVRYYNLDFKECVEGAYNEIANRKSKMINGTFVKEADL